jgi:LysM repeat protein
MFSKTLVSFAVLAVAASGAIAAPACTETYTVQAGDSCNAISYLKKISTYQLSDLNDSINDDCTNLMAGQKLCLAVTGEDTCHKVHVVIQGDTCSSIVNVNGITMGALHQNNPQLNDDCDIYVGEVLAVCDDGKSGNTTPGGSGSGGNGANTPKKPIKNVLPPPGSKPAVEKPAPAPEPTPKDDGKKNDNDDQDPFAGLPDCEDPEDDGYYH